MLVTTPVFLFLFLPGVIAAVLLFRRLRNPILLVVSLFFYTWGEGWLVLAMVASIGIDFTCGLKIDRNPARKRIWLLLSIFANLSLLAVFKYFHFGIESLNAILSWIGRADLQWHPGVQIALPIGISFFTFQSMSYTFDVYLGRVKPTRDPIRFFCFVSMFPQLLSGPIVRYREIQKELMTEDLSVSRFALGVRRFTFGLARKVLIADTLARMSDPLLHVPADQITVGLAWLAAVSVSLWIYHDFAGYTDMAIGMGEMLGFRFPENFNLPYLSRSIGEFWRRWHMTLFRWMRDYLYRGLGGGRKGRWFGAMNILLVFAISGLWHGATWIYVLWGIYHGGLVVGERLLSGRIAFRPPRLVQHAVVLLLVIFGWFLLWQESISGAFFWMKALFGFAAGDGVMHPIGAHMNPYGLSILIAGAVTATPILSILGKRIQADLARFLEIGVLVPLLIFSFSSLAAYGSTPFLYFRF